MNYIKDFTKAITMLSSANDVYSIFRDWLFVASSSLIQANNCIANKFDEKCYQMSFIQFSILGISAVLKLGNTLSSEILEEVKTLAYLLNYPISYNSKKTKTIK